MATIISENPDQTRAIAARFAETLPRGCVVAVSGGLGAGKTHFIQGAARALGCAAAVTSPTFTLVHEYPSPEGTIHHVDLYRIADARECAAIGLDEICGAGRATFIEWPERLGPLLPADALKVGLRIIAETTREITLPDLPGAAPREP